MEQLLKDWGTLLIALWGAGLSTWNFVKAEREAKRARIASNPWGTLAVLDGDAKSRMIQTTFRNPSRHEVQIEHVEVEVPKGWHCVPFENALISGIKVKTEKSAPNIKLPIRIGLPSSTPSQPVVGQKLLISAPDWEGYKTITWHGDAGLITPIPLVVVFRGRALSAGREAVEIRVSADVD